MVLTFRLSLNCLVFQPSGGCSVQDTADERWKSLCEQASVEQDPQKLIELIKEINYLLEAKRSSVTRKEVE